MTVECPACKTRFPVDHRKIPAGGVHARCSECEEVFFVADPASVLESAVEVIPEEIKSPYEESSPFEASEPAGEDSGYEVETEEQEAFPTAGDADDREEESSTEAEPPPAEAEVWGIEPEAPEEEGQDRAEEPPLSEVSPEAVESDFEPPEPADEEPEPFMGTTEPAFEEPEPFMGTTEPSVEDQETVFHAPEPEFDEPESEDTEGGEGFPEDTGDFEEWDTVEDEELEPVEDLPSVGDMVFEPELQSMDELEPALDETRQAFGGPEPTPDSAEPTFGEAEPTFSMDPSDFGTSLEEVPDTGEAAGGDGAGLEEVSEEFDDAAWIQGEAPPAMGFETPVPDEEDQGETAPSDVAEPSGEVETVEAPAEEIEPRTEPVAERPPLPTPQFGKRDPKEKAQRLARVLVSDIILYNPDRHQRALEAGRIREEFDDEIQKSWNEYVEQVGEDIANDTNFFNQALNEILAKGQQIF